MMTIWKTCGETLVSSVLLEKGCWIEATAPSEKEIDALVLEHQIPRDLILDILDEDERSRIEKFGSFHCLITRIPVFDENREVRFFTLPLGIFITDRVIITLCSRETPVLRELSARLGKIDLNEAPEFLLAIMNDSVARYLHLLKQINRLTAGMEKELQHSVKNTELIQLLRLQKSLLYFTTSLKGNEMLLERFEKIFIADLTDDLLEQLDDVRIELRQAQEMTAIYSNILSGMMEIMASVISNNLNGVMKKLTQISMVLMIPTFIASLYGMNISNLPFHDRSWSFIAILGISAFLSSIGALFFSRQRKIRP